jgi:hypothetical protein
VTNPSIPEPPNIPPTVDNALARDAPLTGLDAARAFLQRLSWPIYLARANKKPHWRGYKPSATTDLAELAHRWKQFPHANPMALIQPPYVVLDVDPRNGGLPSVNALVHQHGPLPPTCCVWTRDSGYHAYYRAPEGVMLPPMKTVLAPGVELLGPGHQITIPGFQHAGGHINTWDEFLHPGTMPCAELPLWILRLREATQTTALPSTRPPTPAPQDPSPYGESLAHTDKTPTFFSSPLQPKATPPSAPTSKTSPRSQGPKSHHNPGGGQDSLPHAPLVLGRLTATQIADVLADPALVPTCLAYLAKVHGRQPPVLGKSFLAWFREEQHASAVFMPPSAEHPNVLYYDFGAIDEHGIPERGQTLPAVLYRLVNGVWPGTLPKTTYLMWAARLVVESGAVKAVGSHFPALPKDAPPAVVRVYRGAEVLERARSILVRAPDEDPDDIPYTESFCARWVGISERAAHDGLMWLWSRGYVLFRRWRKKLAFFVRGTKRLIARLRHAPIATSQQEAIRVNEQAQAAVALEAAPRRRPGQREDPGCAHGEQLCEHCAQARLEAKRAQEGIWHDPSDPYGRQRTHARSPAEEMHYAP